MFYLSVSYSDLLTERNIYYNIKKILIFLKAYCVSEFFQKEKQILQRKYYGIIIVHYFDTFALNDFESFNLDDVCTVLSCFSFHTCTFHLLHRLLSIKEEKKG